MTKLQEAIDEEMNWPEALDRLLASKISDKEKIHILAASYRHMRTRFDAKMAALLAYTGETG